MTLKEALESGKNFKRRIDAYYCIPFHDKNQHRSFSTNDIIADDWEIEEEKIEVTKELAIAVFDKLLIQVYNTPEYYLSDRNEFLKQLGFKDVE